MEEDGKNHTLTGADGKEMRVTGIAHVWVKPTKRGNKWNYGPRTEVKMIITPDLAPGEIFLAEIDLKNLGIIPKDFPCLPDQDKARMTTLNLERKQEKDQEMEELCDEFEDVFSEILTDRKPITAGGPVRIELKEGAVPFHAAVPRRPPRALADAAEDVVKELVASKVIEPVSHATDWVSHAVFVRKPSGKARLCADFTHLNKWTKRPTHGFKGVDVIRQEIKHDTTWLVAADHVHGYLQVE